MLTGPQGFDPNSQNPYIVILQEEAARRDSESRDYLALLNDTPL